MFPEESFRYELNQLLWLHTVKNTIKLIRCFIRFYLLLSRSLAEFIQFKLILFHQQIQTQPSKSTMPTGEQNSTKLRLSTKYDRLIGQTRDLLYSKLTTKKKFDGTFYQFDFDRAMKDDHSIRRFLLKSSGSVDSAVSSIISTFQWIKSNKLRELKDSDFPKEFYLIGPVFRYQPDAAGRPTVYFRIKSHIPIKEMIKLKVQFVAYLILQADDLGGDAGLTTICDVTDISLSNVDLEMALTLAEIRDHFPFTSAAILTIDLPLIARAAYNIVKYILPSEIRNTMANIKREDLHKHVPLENIPPFLGGKCQKPYAGPQVLPSGCIGLAEYARKKFNTSSERSEKIEKLHNEIFEAVKSELEQLDVNGNGPSEENNWSNCKKSIEIENNSQDTLIIS